MRCLPTLLLALAASSLQAQPVLPPREAGPALPPLARCDAAWARRAEGFEPGGLAPAGPIALAVEACEKAVAEAPDDLEAHWKLLRALHFAGEFAREPGPERDDVFERAVAASRRALDALGRAAPVTLTEGEPGPSARELPAGLAREAARIHFWSAIAWGSWASSHGLLSVAREGVAGRLRRHAEWTLALEPDYAQGGAHRLLARLHATLPRIPFVTGWVDRGRSLEEVDAALAVAPDDPGNALLAALTWLALAPERRDDAIRQLERVASLEPDPEQRVEQSVLREEARARLSELRAEAG